MDVLLAVMVLVSKTFMLLLFTLAMSPLTSAPHGLWKARVWSTGKEITFYKFSGYGLQSPRGVMVGRCVVCVYAIKFLRVNFT